MQRVGRGLEGGGDGGPLRGEEVAAEGVFGGEGDGVDDPVELSPAVAQVFRDGADVLRLVDVEFQDVRFGVEAFGRSFREAFRAAEAAQGYLRPLLLGQPRGRVGYGAPVEDARDQYLLPCSNLAFGGLTLRCSVIYWMSIPGW